MSLHSLSSRVPVPLSTRAHHPSYMGPGGLFVTNGAGGERERGREREGERGGSSLDRPTLWTLVPVAEAAPRAFSGRSWRPAMPSHLPSCWRPNHQGYCPLQDWLFPRLVLNGVAIMTHLLSALESKGHDFQQPGHS